MAINYLQFTLDAMDDGAATLEAMASTQPEAHAAAMAEARRLLDWAWREFPDAHGPLDEGMTWQHDLQVQVEAGGWHTLTLTLTGTRAFIEALGEAFPEVVD